MRFIVYSRRVYYLASRRKNAALSGTVNWNSSFPCPFISVSSVVIGKGLKFTRFVDFCTPMVRVKSIRVTNPV